MKDRVKAKRIARYYDQCRLPMWANVLGIVLLVFGLVAAGITAIFHDKYSSIFGAWESALTNVWFIAFIALLGVGALISLGYLLLTPSVQKKGVFMHRMPFPYRRSLFFAPSASENASRTPGGCF